MNTEQVIDGQRFEWDEEKAARNITEHDGVTFFEAASVFADENSLIYPDDVHSEGERRYRTVGRSSADEILVVCYTERESDRVVHIISTWKAESYESKEYREQPL